MTLLPLQQPCGNCGDVIPWNSGRRRKGNDKYGFKHLKTWTAILTGVLFRESDAGRFRINRRVLGAYLTVSILHGLWDGLPVVMIALLVPGLGILIGQAFVGGIGLFILWRRWREAVHS